MIIKLIICTYGYYFKRLKILARYKFITFKVLDMVAGKLSRIEKFDGLGNEGFFKTF